MDITQQYLLDLQTYHPRKAADQEKFNETHTEVFKEFKKIVNISFYETKKIVKQIPTTERNKNLYATLLNGMVCGKMAKAFPDKCKFVDNGRIGCVMSGTIAYFKKLNSKHKPSHAVTKKSLALERNLSVPYKNEETVIWMGYTVTKDWSLVTGLYATYLKDDIQQWKTDILDLLSKENKKVKISTPISPAIATLKDASVEKKKASK